MRRALLGGLVFLLSFSVLTRAQETTPPAAAAPDYVIGPGDLLSIVVYDAPDLSRDVRVSAKGFIQLPLLPDPIQADGRTPEELADVLAHEFQQRQILRNPQVTVLVKEFKSRPVAVLGAAQGAAADRRLWRPSGPSIPRRPPWSWEDSKRFASMNRSARCISLTITWAGA